MPKADTHPTPGIDDLDELLAHVGVLELALHGFCRQRICSSAAGAAAYGRRFDFGIGALALDPSKSVIGISSARASL